MTAFGWIYNISIIYRDYGQFYFLFVFLMQELETLLTSLIQRGWKPWGLKYFIEVFVSGVEVSFTTKKNLFSNSNLRSIVSLESWLWQFCMENGLLNSPDQYPHKDFRAKNPRPYWEMSLGRDCYYKTEVYQYRLIESALIPEEELGQFLVDNIVVEWKN